MEAALARLERSELAREWLNLPRMRGIHQSLPGGIDGKVLRDVEAVLLRGVTVGLFLERFETGIPND